MKVNLSAEDQKAITEQCAEWFREAQDAKEAVAGPGCREWDRYDKYYHEGSEAPRQVPKWQADVRVNLLNSRVDRIIGLYVGERPRGTYEAQEPDDILLAEYLSDLVESDWENGGYDRAHRAVMTDAAVLGTGFWKTWMDPVSKRVRVARIDPRKMVVDPESDPALLAPEFIGEVGEISLSKLMAMFGKDFERDYDKASPFTPVEKSKSYDLGGSLPSLGVDSVMNLRRFSYPGQPADRGIGGAKFQFGEFYVRRIASLSWRVSKQGKARLEEYTTPVCLQVVGDKVMRIEPFTAKHGPPHPYTIYRAALRTNSIYGAGDVYGVMKVQEGLDTIVSRVVQHTQLVVNPQYVEVEGAVVDAGPTANAMPGKRWKVTESNALTPLRMPSLGGEVLGVIELMVSFLDDRTGVNESVQGRKQAGITSGKHEQTLQSQFAERNKPRLDDRNESIKHWLRRYADLVLSEEDGYTKKQVQRVLGKDRADDWDELKRDAKGEFDVRVQVGAGIDTDPESASQLVVQTLLPSGLLGAPEDPQTQIRALTALRKVWSGADDRIREIRRQMRQTRNDEADAQMEGMPPEGAAPMPPDPMMGPPMPAAPVPQEVPVGPV